MLRVPRRAEFLLVCCAAAVDRKLLMGTRLYPSPDEAPIDHAWVYLEEGRIKAVGPK